MGCGSSILCCWEAEEKPYFPLMELPNELILMILHRMTTSDRLRARVNRKLYLLESVGKFHAKELIVGRNWRKSSNKWSDCYFKDQDIQMKVPFELKDRCCVDGLKKLSSNVCMDKLEVAVMFTEDCLFFRYINRIPAAVLCVVMRDHLVKASEELLDDYLEEWICNREILKLACFKTLRSDHLIRVFNGMERDECSLRSFIVKFSYREEYRSFLGILGILYVGGQFSSERRDVEVYQRSGEELIFSDFSFHFYIVIGLNMVITCPPLGLNNKGHLRMTRFNDDGSVRNKIYNHGTSIRDIRMCKWNNIENALVKLPVTYR